MQLKFVQYKTKQRNQPITSNGLRIQDEQLNPQLNYLSARFFLFFLAKFFLQPQTLHDGGCLHSLFIYIF